MHSDPDDEALSWDGVEPDHVAARPAAQQQAHAGVVDEPGPAASGSVLLVAYGIFAGIALLYSIGWFVAVQRDTFTQASLFAEIMYQFGEFLAIASPLIWIGSVLLLTRAARPLVRVALLIAGVLLLAPWPFILGA